MIAYEKDKVGFKLIENNMKHVKTFEQFEADLNESLESVINQIPGEVEVTVEDPSTFLKDPRDLDKAIEEVQKYLTGGKEAIGGYMIDRYLKDSFDLDAFIKSVQEYRTPPEALPTMESEEMNETKNLNDLIHFIKYEVDFVPDDIDTYKKQYSKSEISKIEKALQYRKKNFDRLSKDKLKSFESEDLNEI